jgi:hypothetical protein
MAKYWMMRSSDAAECGLWYGDRQMAGWRTLERLGYDLRTQWHMLTWSQKALARVAREAAAQ